LRGTLTEVPAIFRAVLHAFELAQEDIRRWCVPLTKTDWNARPFGLPSVAFHIRHIIGSLDRLLTYAEGRELTSEQLAALRTEIDLEEEPDPLMQELDAAIKRSSQRIHSFFASNLEESRFVGKKRLPATLAGLLIHLADHTQRHVGQAITTAKVLVVLAETRS